METEHIKIIICERKGKIDTAETQVQYNYQGLKTVLNIGSFAKKHNAKVLGHQGQYDFVNRYLRLAGIVGDMNLIYAEAKARFSVETIDLTTDMSTTTLRSEAKAYCHRILNLINIDHITSMLKDINMEVPHKLKDDFDMSLELDGVVSKDQTYTKREYVELVSIAIVIKMLIPVLGEAYGTHPDVFLKENETLSFLDMISEHPFMHTAPMERLLRYITAHVNKKVDTSASLRIVAMRANVSEESFVDLMLANSLFKKFAMSPLTISAALKGNLAALVFNVVDNATKSQVAVANRVSIKQLSRPGDGEDSSSVIEGYMQSSEISLGQLAEFNHATSDPEFMYSAMGGTNMSHLKRFKAAAAPLYNNITPLSKGSVLLTSYIVHDKIVDCRTIQYIDYTNVVNCMVASAAYIYENGHREMANMILIISTGISSVLPIWSPKNALDVLKKELSGKYIRTILKPKKGIGSIPTDKAITNVIIPLVNSFNTHFLDGIYKFILDDTHRPDIMNNETDLMVMPPNFKSLLIEVLLFLNEDPDTPS